MDGGIGEVAAISSLASLGLGAMSSVQQGAGTKAADEYQAAKAEEAAKIGRVNSDLAYAGYTEKLNNVLGNIEVMRAAGNIDPTSPTTSAIEDWNRMQSDRQRGAQVLGLQTQAAQDEASAKYLREAGGYAQTQGYLGAGIKVAGGLAQAFGPGKKT